MIASIEAAVLLVKEVSNGVSRVPRKVCDAYRRYPRGSIVRLGCLGSRTLMKHETNDKVVAAKLDDLKEHITSYQTRDDAMKQEIRADIKTLLSHKHED